jgi:hypothetical protein
MMISDPVARQQRALEKRAAILRFLEQEIWSTAPILGQVVGLKDRQPAQRMLNAMEKEGTLRRGCINSDIDDRALTIWGITTQGRLLSPSADPLGPIFEPSRLTPSTMPHCLGLQAIRLRCEAAGWTDWERVPGAYNPKPGDHRPDATVRTIGGKRVAIEYERTVKSAKRYQQIISAHLRAIEQGRWVGVFYVCPPSLAQGLPRLFTAIRILPGGVIFDDSRRSRFKIVGLEDFPQ